MVGETRRRTGGLPAPLARRILLSCALALLAAGAAAAQSLPYRVVDTGQTKTYDGFGEIAPPASGEAYYGQDAQCSGPSPAYRDNGDGTVTDLVTGLMWSRSPDLNGDGVIDAADKRTYDQAVSGASSFALAGYADWRLPSVKELYSLIDFRGTDPAGPDPDPALLRPFIDTSVFAFGYGDTSAGDRLIDAQFASCTRYVSTTMGGAETMFGVNFADGRIKGYPTGASPMHPDGKTFYVLYVRGNGGYGKNDFSDGGDGTVTDRATGLMWARADSGYAMTWEGALLWVQAMNAEGYLGHEDWRLPNAKELQSIVDYDRSPDTTAGAALDPVFSATPVLNEGGEEDFGWYWTGTTHAATDGTGRAAVYVAFGRALGWMSPDPQAPCLTLLDVHGAGAQRSDPKEGSPGDYPLGQACGGGFAYGRGPQGDVVRVLNFVRPVRDAGTADVTVTGVVKAGNPFRLLVSGSGFEPGCAVTVDGVTAPRTVYSNEGLVKAKGGSALKALVPKGVPVQVRAVNPDGSTSAPFAFTR